MKPRRNNLGRVAEMVGGAAAAVRKRGEERAPRAVVYDAAGHPRLVSTAGGPGAELAATAAAMIELAQRSRSGERA